MDMLKNKVFLAKGKRSLVYVAEFKGRKVVVKEEKPGTGAVNRIENEAYWLQELNKHGIGPKFYLSGKGFVVMGYVQGERILDWMPEHDSGEIKQVLKEVLYQCRKLDELNVSKEEMHNPYKHILVKGKKAVMIDFERCHRSENPKNVRQFCQFLISKKVYNIISSKRIHIDAGKLIVKLQSYKEDNSVGNFREIVKALGL